MSPEAANYQPPVRAIGQERPNTVITAKGVIPVASPAPVISLTHGRGGIQPIPRFLCTISFVIFLPKRYENLATVCAVSSNTLVSFVFIGHREI